MLARLKPLIERAKARPKLAGGVAGGVLLLVLLAVVFSGGGGKEGATGEQPPGMDEEADHMAAAPRRPDKPLSHRQRLEMRKRLVPMETDEILRELSVLEESDRVIIVAEILSERLWPLNQSGEVSGEDLSAFLKLGRKLSPKGLQRFLDNSVPRPAPWKFNLLAPRNWERHGLEVFLELSETARAGFGAKLLQQLSQQGTTLPALVLWHDALAEAVGDSIKGADATRISLDPRPFTREVADRMLSQILLLRHGTTLYAGLCVARDEDLTVLTQPVGAGPADTPPAAVWEAATLVNGKQSWIPATRTFDTADPYRKDQRAPNPHLLVFPPVGTLADAAPVKIAPAPVGPVYCLRAPIPAESPFPMPAEWWVAAAHPQMPLVRFHKTIDSLLFTGDGELATVQSFAAPVVERALQPRALVQQVELEPEDNGPLVATYRIWDVRKTIAGMTARVCLQSTLAEAEKAEKAYVGNLDARRKDPATKDQPAFAEAREIPLELAAGQAVLRIDSPPSDGTPILVQLCLHLADGEVRHLPPSILYAAGNRPQGSGQWLVSAAARRFVEARAKCLPLAMDYTVDGVRRRYGDVAVTYLALNPDAIIMDQTATHVYVADEGGIRRIRLQDFRETVGLSIPGDVLQMTASSLGLAVAVRSAGELTLRVFDAETLAGKLCQPIGTEPTHLLGSWQSPRLVAINSQSLSLVDLAASKLVQRIGIAELAAPAADAKGTTPPGTLRAAALSADGKELRLTIGAAVRRFALLEGGLGPALPAAPDPDQQYAIFGTRIYDLRTTPPQITDLVYHQPLAVDLAAGRILARPIAPSGAHLYCLLDRRGVELAAWPTGSRAKPPETHRVLAHPDGTHYLLWSPSSACWITLGDGGGTEQ